jgi:hypothetical protein
MEILNNTCVAMQGIQVIDDTITLHLKVPTYKSNNILYMWERPNATKHTLDLVVFIKNGLIEYSLSAIELCKLGAHETLAHSKTSIAVSSSAEKTHTILNLIKLETDPSKTIHIEYVSGC